MLVEQVAEWRGMRSLAKNRAQLEVLFGLANLVPAKRALLA
jgi:hypothetical protein